MFARDRREAQAMIETLTSPSRQRGPLRADYPVRARSGAGTHRPARRQYYLIVIIAAVRKQLQFVGAELVLVDVSTSRTMCSLWI